MKTRKGFTLVELLIVIVVMGILATMMMLSSTETVTSARASNIVGNFRNLKTAALGYYTDHIDDLEKTTTAAPTISDILPYLSNKDIPDLDNYKMTFAGNNNIPVGEQSWYLCYENTHESSENLKVREKLKGRAKSVGLLQREGDNPTDEVYDGTSRVFYKVR